MSETPKSNYDASGELSSGQHNPPKRLKSVDTSLVLHPGFCCCCMR